MMVGLFPGAWGVLSAVSAVSGYAAYAVCIPLLLANDVLAFAGRGPFLLPTDALGFLTLSGGTLVRTLLVLLGGRRKPGPVDIDMFCGEHELSVREREVLLRLAEGLRYKQIADRLCIALDTVKSHASRIYRKTEASGRADLLYRIRLGRL